MKRLLIFTALLALLFNCTKQEDVIKIGISMPLTGSIAKMGVDFKNGALLAVEEFNSRGGVRGKKIELLIEDDANDPKQAVSVANKFLNSGVTAVIGHFTSSCTMAAIDVYNKAGVPVINGSSTTPLLTQKGYKNIFRISGRDDLQGVVAAGFVSERLAAKRVAILHDKTTYGQGLAEEFKRAVEGKAEVVYFGGITQGDKDFKPVLTTIKQSDPQVIYFGGLYPEGGLIVKQANELGIKSHFIGGDAFHDTKFIDIAGERAAEGAFMTFSPDVKNRPESKAFLDKYISRFGEPGTYSIYSYDAANILLRAINEAPDTKGASISDKIRGTRFMGVLSEYSFDQKGDVTHMPYVVWTVNKGKFIEFWKPQGR